MTGMIPILGQVGLLAIPMQVQIACAFVTLLGLGIGAMVAKNNTQRITSMVFLGLAGVAGSLVGILALTHILHLSLALSLTWLIGSAVVAIGFNTVNSLIAVVHDYNKNSNSIFKNNACVKKLAHAMLSPAIDSTRSNCI